LKYFFDRSVAKLLDNTRIVSAIISRVPESTLRNLLGRDFLSPIQQFALDGYNDKLFKNLPLNSNSTVIVLGGYLGDSVANYRRNYNSSVYSTEPIYEYFSILQKRFGGDSKIYLFNEATADKNSQIELFVSGEKTGLYEIDGTSRLVKSRDVVELIDIIDKSIDHIEINIEGGEYYVLQRLIDSSYINKCESILIQFHNYGLKQELDRADLRVRISATHKMNYCYDWVWEHWIRI